MGSSSANISRNMYDERKRHIQLVLQQGVPWVDADVNDGQQITYNLLRRVQQLLGDGSPNNGFQIVGTGATNDFTIKGGGGTLDSAGQMYVKGLGAFLISDITYKGTPASGITGEDQRSIHPKLTSVSFDSIGNVTTLGDSSANYTVNELAGRTITPDVDVPATTFTITANTATTITVSGNATSVASAGDRYRVELSTPSGDRTDAVYLNAWLDEIDPIEDPDLYHAGALQVEGMRRRKLEQNLFIREGDASSFTDYTDSDGNEHKIFRIATLSRLDANATITSGMVTDLRTAIIPPSQIGNTITEDEIDILKVIAIPGNEGGPTANCRVLPGKFLDITTKKVVELTAQTDIGPFSVVSGSGKVRFDTVVIDDTGTVSIVQGVEQTAPQDALNTVLDLTKCTLAIVQVDESGTVTITDNDITRTRDILSSPGAVVLTTDTRIPTQDENDALVAETNFTNPSSSNKFVTKEFVDRQIFSVLRARPTTTPSNKVYVKGGLFPWKGGRFYRDFADDLASALTFSPASASRFRYDLLGIRFSNDPPVTEIVTGTESASNPPPLPTVPADFMPICFVKVSDASPAVITLSDILDARSMMSIPDSPIPVGMMMPYLAVAGTDKTVQGWLPAVGAFSVGSTGSAATYKGDEYRELFEFLKNVTPNSGAVWANNDSVIIPNVGNRVVGGYNSSVSEYDTIGKLSGAATHSHTGTTQATDVTGFPNTIPNGPAQFPYNHVHPFFTDVESSYQPQIAAYWLIKY